MNSKERMLAALEGNNGDHIPCSFMLFYNLYDNCTSELEYITKEIELGFDPYVHVGHLNHTMHLTGTLHPDAKYSEWVEVKDGVKYFCRKIDTPKGPLTGRVKQWDGWPTEGDFPIFKDWIVPRSQEFLVKPEQDLEKIKYLFGPFKDADIEQLKEEAHSSEIYLGAIRPASGRRLERECQPYSTSGPGGHGLRCHVVALRVRECYGAFSHSA